MGNFLFSESGVKKNYFRLFVKKAVHVSETEISFANGGLLGVDDATSYAGVNNAATGIFGELYTGYYEQIGSCNAEPKVTSSDVDGKVNNVGTTLGASKEMQIEMVLADLSGDNYDEAVALDGTTVSFVYVDENSGVLYHVAGVSVSTNLSATGNSFEELPITAKKEATSITDIVNRYVYTAAGSAPTTGGVETVSIFTAGEGYVTEAGATQVAILPTSSTGTGAEFSITASAGAVTVAAMSTAGTGYQVGDILSITGPTGGAGCMVKVATIA